MSFSHVFYQDDKLVAGVGSVQATMTDESRKLIHTCASVCQQAGDNDKRLPDHRVCDQVIA